MKVSQDRLATAADALGRITSLAENECLQREGQQVKTKDLARLVEDRDVKAEHLGSRILALKTQNAELGRIVHAGVVSAQPVNPVGPPTTFAPHFNP